MVFVVASCVVLTGCITGARPSFSTDEVLELGPPPSIDGTINDIESVVVIGDSITAASADAIRYVLTASGVTDITIDGVASRRIEVGNGSTEPLSGVRTLTTLVADGAAPDVWVIALGTNDLTSYSGAEAYAALVDEVIALISPSTTLVWIDAYLPQHLEQSEVFNEVLRTQLGERGNAAVGSWFAVAAQPDTDLLRNDQIHPNNAGRIAFATVIANALARVT